VQQKLFLYDEVLHMNVDNLVESGGRAGVNSAKFNTMIRIAQFWCNAPDPDRRAGNFSNRVTKVTELWAEKHKSFQRRKSGTENVCMRMHAKKENSWNIRVKQFCLTASFADFNTTSAGDQGEF
jgi:hypothetical protein